MHRPAVLLIHGFASHRSSLERLLPELDRRGFPWVYPVLTGHGQTPEALTGVGWSDWHRDVEQAFQELASKHGQIVIIALSMGCLLAIELAASHPSAITGLVLLSPGLRFQHPLAPFTPVAWLLIRRFPFPAKNKFSSPEYARLDRGYQWFPTAAYASYWRRTRTITQLIPQIKCPVKIIHSQRDRIAKPSGATEIFRSLKAPKKLVWLESSGHELLLDSEADYVIHEIFSFYVLIRGSEKV